MTIVNNACDRCGKTAEEVGWFPELYRRKEFKAGRPDPCFLCGACAGARIRARIMHDLFIIAVTIVGMVAFVGAILGVFAYFNR